MVMSRTFSPSTTLACRELQSDDFDGGFLDLLEHLTTVHAHRISKDAFEQRLHDRNAANVHTFVMVVDNANNAKGGTVVGTASLVIEAKFIHQLSSVGHIEDVVVHPNYAGRGLGRQLVLHALREALETHSCYKVLLNCARDNSGFYSKCGFEEKSVGMALYAEDATAGKR